MTNDTKKPTDTKTVNPKDAVPDKGASSKTGSGFKKSK